MIRTQVSLDAEMYERARREARRQGISFAELCRRSLARILASGEEDPPWMRFAGVLEGGGTGASRSVDAVVYGRERP